MALPEIIEIVPPQKPIEAEFAVPGSKSITNRALIAAALSKGAVTLNGALFSEDTQVMIDSLRKLGFSVQEAPDPAEAGNRMITVQGQSGAVPNAGSAEQPLELSVGNAGTAARFLAALVCLGRGVFRLDGTSRMRERPQAGLFAALRQLGYRVEATEDRLPATIFGDGPKPGAKCSVDISQSSQFASALLLASEIGGWQIEVTGENQEETSYVSMTRQMMRYFPKGGGEFQVEPDASSASYFHAAARLLPFPSRIAISEAQTRWQIDAAFPEYVPLPEQLSRQTQLGDSILTAMILATFAKYPVKFTDLERLRVQECERVFAMKTELSKCGIKVEEEGQTLTVFPTAKLRGATIETYNDHRIAMCFAILGLKVNGIKIQNPACVKKTFPNFFQKLAAPPPLGLGIAIFDAKTVRKLGVNELFAK